VGARWRMGKDRSFLCISSARRGDVNKSDHGDVDWSQRFMGRMPQSGQAAGKGGARRGFRVKDRATLVPRYVQAHPVVVAALVPCV